MKQSDLIKERLRQVMLNDRVGGIETLLTVLKSDLKTLLLNYMTLDANDVQITADLLESGGCEFIIKARAERLIDPGKMLAR